MMTAVTSAIVVPYPFAQPDDQRPKKKRKKHKKKEGKIKNPIKHLEEPFH